MISFTDVDTLVKLIGGGIAVLAFILAQWFAWRRYIRERQKHKAVMELLRAQLEYVIDRDREEPEQ